MSLTAKIVKQEEEAAAVSRMDPGRAARRQARLNRIDRVTRLIVWEGWKLIQVPGDRFAFVRLNNEGIREPNSGSFTLTEAEQFLAAKQREEWRW